MTRTPIALVLAASLACIGGVAGRATANPAPTVPATVPVYQRPEADPLAGNGAIVAFASTAGPSFITSIAFIPVNETSCSSTDYDTLDVYDVDAAGDVSGAALYSGAASCAGSGDWSAGRPAFVLPIAHALPASHTLAAIWRPVGAGMALPGGAWRVE